MAEGRCAPPDVVGPGGRGPAVVSMLALLLAGTPAAAAADGVLYLRAVDMLGAPVLDLRPDEVRVREDGAERAVLDVRLANLPIDLRILVDNSRGGRATRGVGAARLLHYRAGLATLVEALPPNQLVSILPLAGPPRWLLAPTTDRGEMDDRIAGLAPGRAGMHFLDALDEAAREIDETGDPVRPVIVIVTAVARERSRVTPARYEIVAERLRRQGTTVHAVVVTGSRTGSVGDDFISRACAQLARLTGGYHRRIARTNAVGDLLGTVATTIRTRNRELSRQLVIRYDRPDDAPPAARVAVEIGRDHLRWDLTPDGRVR